MNASSLSGVKPAGSLLHQRGASPAGNGSLHLPQRRLIMPQTQLARPEQRTTSQTARKTVTNAVSVPKVLVRPPGQRQSEWVDLWEAYTYNKVVFIKEAVTEDVANNMIALSLYLDSLDQKRVYYWLNCPGGEVVPTLALYDTMQYMRSPTATVCYGLCLGMGGFLLTAGGEKGFRYAMPHSILMMHHPSGASRGQASEMQIEARELVRIRDYLTLLTSNATGQPYDRVIRELSRNKWMDSKEAIEYGMIDKVLHTPMPKMTGAAGGGPTFNFSRTDGPEFDAGL